jgi:hypothetical protein
MTATVTSFSPADAETQPDSQQKKHIRKRRTFASQMSEPGATRGLHDTHLRQKLMLYWKLPKQLSDDIFSKLAVILSNSKLIMEYSNYQLEPIDFTTKCS